jgi:hypothetical protein
MHGTMNLKKNRWWICVPTDINKCKLKTGKRSQKPELTGRSPLRRRRSTLDCKCHLRRREEEGEEQEELKFSNIHLTRCNVTQFLLSGNCSTCFGWYHNHHQEHKQLYLQRLVYVTPLLLSAAIVEELALV